MARAAREHRARRMLVPPGLEFSTVDIYLSAGPRELTSTEYRSCNRHSFVNCSIWQVRVTFSAAGLHIAANAEKVLGAFADEFCPGGWGFVEPDVSPSGERLAWVSRCHEPTAFAGIGVRTRVVIGQLVSARDFITGEGGIVDYGWDSMPGSHRRPQYPDWYAEDTLTYDKPDGATETNTLWYAYAFPDWKARYALRGPGAYIETGTSFQDAESHPSPAYTGSGSGPRIVSFGGDPYVTPAGATKPELVPRAHGLFFGATEEFVVDSTWRNLGLPECHHPSWNISGTEVLCTRYQDPESLQSPTTTVFHNYRQLYGFTWGAAWTTPVNTPLFPTLMPTEVAALGTHPNGAPFYPEQATFPGPGCGSYVWKFGHWCGSDRYVVATVYCSDATGSEEESPPLASRVYLIDTSADTTQPAAYFDLVAPIEDAEHVEPGSYHAIFSDCGALRTPETADAPAGL